MKKKKVKYTDGPIGKIKIVEDFLPKASVLDKKLITIEQQQDAQVFRGCKGASHKR